MRFKNQRQRKAVMSKVSGQFRRGRYTVYKKGLKQAKGESYLGLKVFKDKQGRRYTCGYGDSVVPLHKKSYKK